jgi:hypothetical protein
MIIKDGDKCHLCSGKMSKAKPITDGPKKGQNRKYCLQCGHIVILGAIMAEPEQPEQKVAAAAAAVPAAHTNTGGPTYIRKDGRWELA